jgi:putative membrane protein
MTGILLDLGVILGAIASLLHVVIFVMESVLWTRPTVWRRFGLKTADEAATTQPLALNQGFYNLFLAIGTATGIGLTAGGNHESGLALVTFCCGSMVAAAAVLVSSDPAKARAAVVQAGMPAIALLWLLVRVLVG